MAAGLCLTGALLALPCCAWTNDPKRMLPGVLLGIGIRSGIPLGGGIGLYLTHPLLAEAGLLYYLVVFYIPLWVLETYMSLPKPGNNIPPMLPSGHRSKQAGNRTTSEEND
jgi:hypothetical protein